MQLLPDPDNHQEMWMVIQMAAALSRANEWVFLGVLLLLIGYAIARAFYALVTYLITTYRIRLREDGWHVRYFRIALGVAALVAILGAVLISQQETHEFGKAILALGFCLFAVFVAGLDWYVDRKTASQPASLPGDTTYDDIIAWQMNVKQAQEAGRM